MKRSLPHCASTVASQFHPPLHPALALTCQRQDASMPPPPSATVQRLRPYIAKRMRMSHVVQPLML